jgi:ribonuclease P protein component
MTAGDLDSSQFGRIVRPADYVRVLATPMRLRSVHFAVHHLDGRPLPLKRPMARPATGSDVSGIDAGFATAGSAPVNASLSTELSTGRGDAAAIGVDDSPPDGPLASAEPVVLPGPDRWLGLVVPKRHAKRAVTRTLVKRQIRNVAAACAPRLEPGLWVVRQRSPFDPKQFPSAASEALKDAARAELRALFERAARGERDRMKPRAPGAAPFKGRTGKGAKATGAASPAAAAGGAPCAS